MPSRMERYHDSSEETQRRTVRNQDLYKTIYDEVEYTNVEGISIIEKNEKIDIDKIRELIGTTTKPELKKEPIYETSEPIIEDYEEKNYDIRDVLDKAKNERPEKNSNTQYDILKGININDNYSVPQSLSDDDLKKMIETITNNSKNQTGDLLDDLKTTHDSSMRALVEEEMEKTDSLELDKSFYTSSLGFTTNDFEDLKEIKDDIKVNNALTKILLSVLLALLVIGAIVFILF